MSTVRTMTAEILAQHQRVGIPANCVLCESPILEGQMYTGSGLVTVCGPCAVQRARARVEDAETILLAEQEELHDLTLALDALPAPTTAAREANDGNTNL